MKADFQRSFDEQFKKLTSKQKIKVKQTLVLFLGNPEHPTLRNHPLKGEWSRFRSISAGGDLRLHYRTVDDETVLFVAVGSHSQLYK